MGRPTKYQVKFNKQAEKLCKLGATDMELAEFFEVNKDTIAEWKLVHPQFSDSIKKGKIIADYEVANKLYTRAMGYKYNEVTFERIDGQDVLVATSAAEIKANPTYKKKVVTKEVIPDTTAQIFWLKNRRKETWRDKQELGFTDGDGNDVALKIGYGGKKDD